MSRRTDITVREALLEMKVRKLEEELYVLKMQKNIRSNSAIEDADDHVIIVDSDNMFHARNLRQAVGVEGCLTCEELKVRAWFQSDATKVGGEEFKLGYFVGPLIKTNPFLLAQELGEMHYKFVMNIAGHIEHKYGNQYRKCTEFNYKKALDRGF